MKAKLIHHYGFSEKEINQMAFNKFIQFQNAMTAMKAEDSILGIQVASFHTFKKEIRSKIIRNLKKQVSSLVSNRVGGALPTYQNVINNLRSKLGG